jgi:CHAD domain-containing protein
MPRTAVELSASEHFELPALQGRATPARFFTETYYDTAGGRLGRAGFMLSRRVENGKSIWRLTVVCDGTSTLDVEAAGGPAEPPEELSELITAASAGFTIVPVARLRTRSTGLRVKAGSRSLARIDVARIAVLDAQRVTRTFCEIRIEPLAADRTELVRLEKALKKAGAKRAKRNGGVRWTIESEPAPELPLPTHGLETLRAFIQDQYARILGHDPGARLGKDPEDVHQLRVALRRLRSVLKTATPLLDTAWVDSIREELSWLAGELGPARDVDVLIPSLRAEADSLEAAERESLEPLFSKFEAAKAGAAERALEALRSERYLALLASIEAAATGPPPGGKGALAEKAANEYRRLRKAMEAVDEEPTDDAIHRARIQGKRARYATELLEGELGKAGRNLIRAAKRFQDVAGEHHDTVVAEEEVRARLRGLRSQATAVAAGLLIARLRERRGEAALALPDAWSELDDAARKVWS